MNDNEALNSTFAKTDWTLCSGGNWLVDSFGQHPLNEVLSELESGRVDVVYIYLNSGKCVEVKLMDTDP